MRGKWEGAGCELEGGRCIYDVFGYPVELETMMLDRSGCAAEDDGSYVSGRIDLSPFKTELSIMQSPPLRNNEGELALISSMNLRGFMRKS